MYIVERVAGHRETQRFVYANEDGSTGRATKTQKAIQQRCASFPIKSSKILTALSECNGNVRIFLKRRTYVVSILGIAQIPSFTLTLRFNPLVKEIQGNKMVHSNI